MVRSHEEPRAAFALTDILLVGGGVILATLLLVGFLSEPQDFRPVVRAGQTASSTVTVGNALPTVTSVVLNNASSITLTANTTTAVNVTAVISDNNGCSDITAGNASTSVLLYRSGITSSTCLTSPVNLNYLNCYLAPSFTISSTCSGGTVNTTTTLNIWYLAEATDASSSYPSQTWTATVIFKDANNGTGTSDSAGQEMNTLSALNVETSSINYGTLVASSTTGGTNQTAQVKNAGNSSTTLRLHGNAMASGASSIATGSQHYATGTFTYGTSDNQLQETATDVGGFSVPRPPLAVWAATTAYQNTLRESAVVATNGFVYVLGGIVDGGTSGSSTVRYAQIGATGSLGAWATTTALLNTRILHAADENNGYMYVVGGYVDSDADDTSTVLYAAIGSTGTLGAWATTTAYPHPVSGHGIVTDNNYLYVLGGYNNNSGQTTATVRYAPIGSTGTIGSWATTTAYPGRMRSYSALINNRYMYVSGGDVAGNYTSTVNYAPIGTTGTIGQWASTTPLPTTTVLHSMVADGGFLFVIGGKFVGSNATSTTLFAPIGSTGTIGSWATTLAYPSIIYSAVGNHSAPYVAVYNGIAYVVGGCTNGASCTQTSTVRYASLASRNTYWGMSVPAGTPTGTYQGQNTFTVVFQP